MRATTKDAEQGAVEERAKEEAKKRWAALKVWLPTGRARLQEPGTLEGWLAHCRDRTTPALVCVGDESREGFDRWLRDVWAPFFCFPLRRDNWRIPAGRRGIRQRYSRNYRASRNATEQMWGILEKRGLAKRAKDGGGAKVRERGLVHLFEGTEFGRDWLAGKADAPRGERHRPAEAKDEEEPTGEPANR